MSLRFVHGGAEYRLGFQHEGGAYDPEPGVVYTSAILDFRPPSEGAAWEEGWRMRARCSPLDHFVKEVGRQIALDRLAERVRAHYAALAGEMLKVYYTRPGAKVRLIAQPPRPPKWNGVHTP